MSPPLPLVHVVATLALASAPEVPTVADGPNPTPAEEPRTFPELLPPPRPKRELASWDEARDLLRAHSTDDRMATANLARAEGAWRQALGALLPNLRFGMSLTYDLLNPEAPPLGFNLGAPVAIRRLTPTSPAFAANAGLLQSVVDLQAWYGLAAAAAQERAAIDARDDLRRRSLLALARSLSAIVSAERVAELNRLGLRQALDRLALMRRMEELGAATAMDVVRLEQDLEHARSTQIAGDEQLFRARESVGLALGFDHEVGVLPDFKLDGLQLQAARTCVPTPARPRADVAAARAREDSAVESLAQARAGYWPSLQLASNVAMLTTEPTAVNVPTWSISALLTIPIWEGGTREGLTKDRAGQLAQAQAAVDQTLRQAVVDSVRAHRSVAVAAALLESARSGREKAEELDRLTKRSFEVGRGTSLELVQSAVLLRQADLGLASRELELVFAKLDEIFVEASCAW